MKMRTLRALVVAAFVAVPARADEPPSPPPNADNVSAAATRPAPSDLPVAFVDRPLTLPELVIAPEFGLAVSGFEMPDRGQTFEENAVGIHAGLAFGVMDDVTLSITPASVLVHWAGGAGNPWGGSSQSRTLTEAYFGTFRTAGMVRFAHADVAEVGARLEFGANDVTELQHLSWGIPVILRAPGFLRIDTGFVFSAVLPFHRDELSSRSDISLGGVIGQLRNDPDASPGIPVTVTFQFFDEFFAGVDSGFGIASFRGDIARACFSSLGFHAGGTIAVDRDLIDIAASLSWPFFAYGADPSPPHTENWQGQLRVRAYFPL